MTRFTRRRFTQVASTIATLPLLTHSQAQAAQPISLRASETSVPLVLDKGPSTKVWAYDGQVPGPLLRYRQGDRLMVDLRNDLLEATTIHWHGLRPPVGMDGVPYLSQDPIEPGADFRYEFDLLDAGTFWYHPHLNSSEQVGRGLHGVLIVDEPDAPIVNRELVWVIDDWRLDDQAQIAAFGQNLHDASHAGRIGNAITVNGSIEENAELFAGERIRLRLLNVANARNFALRFDKLVPWLITLDGQPVNPSRLVDNRVEVAAGQRADLIIDVPDDIGERELVIDDAYGQNYAFEMMHFRIAQVATNGLAGSDPPIRLASNPIAEPDLANAQRHPIVFEGGAMGRMSGAMLNGTYQGMRELAQAGKLWAINGHVMDNVYDGPPLLNLRYGETHIFELDNRTAFDHPIHLHGHGFRVISQNGNEINEPPMRDTTLLRAGDRQEIAFVADNVGQWMFHCHVLEHQAAAMMAVINVT